MPKVYTKTGDKGKTSLLNGERVPKSSLRIECCGLIDEVNSFIGFARTASLSMENSEYSDILLYIQKQLFNIASEVSDASDSITIYIKISAAETQKLEKHLDDLMSSFELPSQFLVPGENELEARLNLARVTVRRAERNLIKLSEESPLREELLTFINRASDLFFVMGAKLSCAPETSGNESI